VQNPSPLKKKKKTQTTQKTNNLIYSIYREKSFRGSRSRLVGLTALGLWQSMSWQECVVEQNHSPLGWEAKERKKGPGSHSLIKGMPPVT
jgi:hypothetical protein